MLYNLLSSLSLLTETELSLIVSKAKRGKLAKGDYLIKEGTVADEVVYIERGILRSFYRKKNGEEVTYCFTFNHNFMAAYSSLITGTPSTENIQALVDTDLLILKKKNLDELYDSGMNYLKVGKFFAEQQYIELERRIFSLQRQSAKERYEDLFKYQPELIKNIPLQYLASFLGITPRHLSRLRKEVVL